MFLYVRKFYPLVYRIYIYFTGFYPIYMISDIVALKSPSKLRIATTVFFFMSGFGYSSWASRIPSIQQQLHLNEAQLGAVLFASPIGLMLTMPVTSWLLGRINSRKILIFGAVSFNLILSLPGFATKTWHLAAALFCFGSTRNLMNLSVNSYKGCTIHPL